VRPFFLPRLSPDGRSLIIGTLGLREQDLWRYEFRERSLTRLTTEGRAEHPLWSPDGSRLAFMSTRAGAFNVYVMRSDGGDAPVRITTGPAEFPGAWTPDGRSLVVGDSGDISIVSVDTAGPLRKLVATRFNERIPDLSPDGRWLTYVSDESGANEVYVRSFPDLGNKRRVSDGGGTEPAWSRNGKKLVFLSPRTSPQGGRLAVVEIDVVSGSTLSMGAPHTLFELDALHYTEASQARGYDMAPDASRFVFVHETYRADIETARTIHYVERWFDQLRQQVPVAR
jgi:Tol biopolymer transport system component